LFPFPISQSDVVELVLCPGPGSSPGQYQVEVGIFTEANPVDEGDLPPKVIGIAANDEVTVQEDIEELGAFIRGGPLLGRKVRVGKPGRKAGREAGK
jgi:hypothetical protein